MHFGLPDDALALRGGLRDLLTTACTPATIRAAWDGSASETLWKELGAFGLFGLLVEADRGGLGLDELSLVAALEEAGYAGAPGPIAETVAYLPQLDLPLDGSVRLAVQRAERTPYAGVATHVLRSGDSALLTDFTVDEVVSVDRSRRVGVVQATSSTDAASSAIAAQRATLGTAALLLGLARRQLDMTVGYVKGRTQFGVPVGSFQAIKHALADAVVATEFAWPVVLHAAYALARRADDSELRVSHAKVAANEAAYRMSRVCLQSHGAIGYTVEYDLHLFAKRTWALAADWGTSSEHRERVAARLDIPQRSIG